MQFPKVLCYPVADSWPRANQQTQFGKSSGRQTETEAEAVAYVICHASGLHCSTGSSDYIQPYAGDTIAGPLPAHGFGHLVELEGKPAAIEPHLDKCA